MKILVTGGTGFIGHHLVRALVKNKRNEVRCLIKKKDKFLKEWNEKRTQDIRELGVDIIYGDLLDKESLKEAVRDVNIVFHLAAIARPVYVPDREYFKVNLEGSKNLIEACLNEKIKKFICISSLSAAGPSIRGKPVNEETPCKPIDAYGRSKLAMEKFIFELLKKHKFPITIVRAPMTYGPGDFELLKIFNGVKKRIFPILKGGKSHFEFCYVENLVQGFLLAEKKGKIGEIYQLSDEKHNVKDIIETIARIEGVKPPRKVPIFVIKAVGLFMQVLAKIFGFHPPFRANTAKWLSTDYWVCDISKAKKELGYKPKISLEEGVRRTVKWYRENRIL